MRDWSREDAEIADVLSPLPRASASPTFPINAQQKGRCRCRKTEASSVDLMPQEMVIARPNTARSTPTAPAESRNAVIIEDDYDSELRFGGGSRYTLQSVDYSGRVTYVDSSKSADNRSNATSFAAALLTERTGARESCSGMGEFDGEDWGAVEACQELFRATEEARVRALAQCSHASQMGRD